MHSASVLFHRKLWGLTSVPASGILHVPGWSRHFALHHGPLGWPATLRPSPVKDRLPSARPQIPVADGRALIADYNPMEIPLREARWRNLLLAVSLLTVAILMFQAGEIWLASDRLASGKLGPMEPRAALVPGNGAARDSHGTLPQRGL